MQCFFGATRATREPARASDVAAADSEALERGEPAIIGGGVLAGVVQVLR